MTRSEAEKLLSYTLLNNQIYNATDPEFRELWYYNRERALHMSFWWKDNRAIIDHLLGYNLTVSPEMKGYKPWFLDDGTPDYKSIGETMIYCAPRAPYDLFLNQLKGMPTLWDKPKSLFNSGKIEDACIQLIIKRAEMMIAEQPDFYLEYTGLNYSHSVLPASDLSNGEDEAREFGYKNRGQTSINNHLTSLSYPNLGNWKWKTVATDAFHKIIDAGEMDDYEEFMDRYRDEEGNVQPGLASDIDYHPYGYGTIFSKPSHKVEYRLPSKFYGKLQEEGRYSASIFGNNHQDLYELSTFTGRLYKEHLDLETNRILGNDVNVFSLVTDSPEFWKPLYYWEQWNDTVFYKPKHKHQECVLNFQFSPRQVFISALLQKYDSVRVEKILFSVDIAILCIDDTVGHFHRPHIATVKMGKENKRDDYHINRWHFSLKGQEIIRQAIFRTEPDWKEGDEGFLLGLDSKYNSTNSYTTDDGRLVNTSQPTKDFPEPEEIRNMFDEYGVDEVPGEWDNERHLWQRVVDAQFHDTYESISQYPCIPIIKEMFEEPNDILADMLDLPIYKEYEYLNDFSDAVDRLNQIRNEVLTAEVPKLHPGGEEKSWVKQKTDGPVGSKIQLMEKIKQLIKEFDDE